MHLKLPSIPYPPAQDGYWHPITATLNFCEEEYYATIYSAEIVNTLTNLLFMYLAYRGCKNCWQNGHESVFFVAFVGSFLVATASCLFHTTLKYPMQLVDELSMIYTTCIPCYASFAHRKSPQVSAMLALTLVSLALFITVSYHLIQDPMFHQVAYAILTAVLVFRSIFLMENYLRPNRWREARANQQMQREGIVGSRVEISRAVTDRRDKDILNTMWMMIAFGLSIFLGGFGIWILDNQYCTTLRRWRRQIGLPWGILLEGHGWWHLMTGVGAYYYIVWAIWLRHCLNNRQDQYVLEWPSLFFSLPSVVKADTTSIKKSA